MTATGQLCTYAYHGFHDYECRGAAHADGQCILHAPADSKDVDAFLAALREKVRQDSEAQDTERIHLEGVVFPGPFSWGAAAEGLEVKKTLDFSEAAFTGEADFSDATFTGNANFSGATFTGDADFSGAIFSGEADFSDATFTGNANFSGAIFSGAADFSGATFTGDAYFSGATFSGEAFFRAIFSGAADFSGATFTGDAHFFEATFRQRLTLRSVNTRQSTAAEGAPLHEADRLAGRAFPLHFSAVVLEQPHLVSFEDADLSRATFLYTNLSQVRFIAVTWAEKVERLWLMPLVKTSHSVVGDHATLESEWKGLSPQERQRRAALVADVYRQLRLNLEGARQEIEAAHFFVGQMDMRLKDSSIPKRHRWPLRLYRGIAMYGESWYRPLAVHLLLGLLFAFLYLWGGFAWSDETFRYNRFDLSAGLPFAAYFRAVFLAVTPGALLGGGFRVISSWLLPWQFVNVISGPFFIGLTLIALRRQFRR